MPRTLRQRVGRILWLAAPITASMLSQNLLNIADTAMLGRVDEAALAAAGISSMAFWLFAAPALGLGAAVQARTAARLGRGRRTGAPLAAALVSVGVISIPWTLLALLLGRPLLGWVAGDADWAPVGDEYFFVRILSLGPLAANFAFRGFWTGVDRPGMYLRVLVSIHVANLLLNWALIFGNMGFPALGAKGAALASTAATVVGSFLHIRSVLSRRHTYGLGKPWAARGERNALIRLAGPNALEAVLGVGSVAVFFWVASRGGTQFLATASVLYNVQLAGLLPAMGLGMAATTLVAQAYGASDARSARRWGWDVATLGAAIGLGAASILWLAPEEILGWFANKAELVSDPVEAVRWAAGGLLADMFGITLYYALLGLQQHARVMRISVVCQWLVFVPLVVSMGANGRESISEFWACYVVYRLAQMLAYLTLWIRESAVNVPPDGGCTGAGVGCTLDR